MNLMIPYLIGVVLGFMCCLDVVIQAKEFGFEWETKGEFIRWLFNPSKRRGGT